MPDKQQKWNSKWIGMNIEKENAMNRNCIFIIKSTQFTHSLKIDCAKGFFPFSRLRMTDDQIVFKVFASYKRQNINTKLPEHLLSVSRYWYHRHYSGYCSSEQNVYNELAIGAFGSQTIISIKYYLSHELNRMPDKCSKLWWCYEYRLENFYLIFGLKKSLF